MDARRSSRFGRIGAVAGATAALVAVGVFATTASAAPARQQTQHVTLVVKSDSEHARKGPDGKWHDAFIQATFTVRAGAKVDVTVLNYDDAPHSFSSSALHVNALLAGEKGKTPGKTTFSFTAPKKAGNYLWWCNQPCDPWAMAHLGYMRGYVHVVA